MNTMHNQ